MWPSWLMVAYQEFQRGVKEIPGIDHEPRILLYHGATSYKATSDEVPWCAAFVCWCLEHGNVQSTNSAAARSYLGWGVGVSRSHPPLGGIVVLKRGGPGQPGPEVLDAQGHVGFCMGLGAPGEILLLGGNQGDRVSLQTYPENRVLGVRWPKGG